MHFSEGLENTPFKSQRVLGQMKYFLSLKNVIDDA